MHQRRGAGRRIRDDDGLGDHAFRRGKALRVVCEECAERIAGAELSAEFCVHLDAGVGGDGFVELCAAGAEALQSPADGRGIDRKEIAGAGGAQLRGGAPVCG